MSKEIMNLNLSLLPVTVTTETGKVAHGHLVQCPSKGGDEYDLHPASGTVLMHGSPLNGPLFLYQTQDEVDAAIFAFNEERKVPIYFADPTGIIEHAHGQKLAFDWPEKCKGKVELRITL